MAKCQYKHESNLPPVASKDEADYVRTACDQRATTELGHSAKESIADWRLPEPKLRGAIIRHIIAGKRMFCKFKDDGSGELLEKHIQANVTLPSGFDIYVEIVLMEEGMIIIYAHNHTPNKLRLPQ